LSPLEHVRKCRSFVEKVRTYRGMVDLFVIMVIMMIMMMMTHDDPFKGHKREQAEHTGRYLCEITYTLRGVLGRM
jgi:hypothetical protein